MVAAALGGALAPAFAAEDDLIKRIDALQKEIDALKSQVQKAQADAAKAQTDASKAAATAQAAAAPAAAAPVTQGEVEGWRKFFSQAPTGEAPATSARTGLTIYGRVDMGYELNDDGTVRRKVLNSYSSRIGFKGTRVLSDDLVGILQIETGIAPDDNANSGTWASRESYFGIASKKAGSIRAGRIDSPFKDLEGYGAPMWGNGDGMETIIHGKATQRSVGSTWNNLHTRFPNVAQYDSPRFANVAAHVAYSTDEVNGATGTVKKPAWAASLEWDNGQFEAGMAYQTTNNFNGQGNNMWGVKASLGGRLGDGTLGALWSKLENGLGRKTNNWSLAGTYKLGPTVLKASYATASETQSGAKDGSTMYGVEVDYPLDKHTTPYVFYSKILNDANAKGRFDQGENTYTPAAGMDPYVFGIALRYNF